MPCKHALEVTTEQLKWIVRQGIKYPNELSESARKLLESIPKTIKIGNFDVPEPMREKPEHGTKFYYIECMDVSMIQDTTWHDSSIQNTLLSRGACHLTRDNCIAHAKALFSFSEVG